MPYKDPVKQKEAQHQHYLDNKEKYRKATKEGQRRRKDWLYDIKDSLVCIKCGENRSPALAFHHKNPNKKEMTISRMLRRCSKKRIMEEIAKCDVLCHNCHAVLHWELQNECL